MAGAVALLNIYVAWRALKGDEKFALIRTFAIAFGAMGGTRFYQADLTRANFTQAILKSTNFRHARLTQVCWAGAQKLDRARVGESILADGAIRDLLITGYGYKKSFIDANLRGANLNGVNLKEANLLRADLSDATLRRANLEQANLREVQAVGTDFTGASLTGACLEAWNIDSTTTLAQIDCRFVYLLEQPNADGHRERRPHHPDKTFQPGDFEKFFKEVLDTVQILIRGGVNPEAFQAAFQQIMQEHQMTPDAVKGIEKTGDTVIIPRQPFPKPSAPTRASPRQQGRMLTRRNKLPKSLVASPRTMPLLSSVRSKP